MFFFCNTHHVVAGAQFLAGLNLHLLLRPFAWWCYWTGWIYPPLHLPPWPGWMNDDVALWWPGAGWWVIDVMSDCGGSGAEEEPSPQEKIQECWGWWRGSPHLSQWRHAESEMYRIYTFFSYCCSHFVSLTLVVWLFPNIKLEAEIWASRLSLYFVYFLG